MQCKANQRIVSDGYQGGARQASAGAPTVCAVVITSLLNAMRPSTFATAEHPLTCVCFSQTLFHMCAPARHHLTSLTFQRNQKFSLHYTMKKSINLYGVALGCFVCFLLHSPGRPSTRSNPASLLLEIVDENCPACLSLWLLSSGCIEAESKPRGARP